MPIYRYERQTIGYALPVTTIARKFARRIDTATVKSAGGTRDILVKGNPWIGASKHYSYISKSYKDHLVVRTVRPLRLESSAQIHVRVNFAAASKWVKDAMMDLMAVTPNQQKFVQSLADPSKKIMGINAKGYSLRGWMFACAYAIKNDSGELPTNHQLPAFDA